MTYHCDRLYSISNENVLPPISGHSSDVYKGSVVIFGGYDGSKRTNDMWRLKGIDNICQDIDLKWQKVKLTGDAIEGRAGHVTFLVDDTLYIHGGYDSKRVVLGDVKAVNLPLRQCNNIVHKVKSGTVVGRRWHVGWQLQDRLFVHGGWNDSGPVETIAMYNIATSTWETIKSTGSIPSPRRWHACVQDRTNDTVYMHGGYDGTTLAGLHTFNSEKACWQKIQCKGVLPQTRCRHKLIQLDDKRLLMCGGYGNLSNSEVCNAVHVLHLDDMSWDTLDVEGWINLRRSGHTMSQLNDQNWLVFGGIPGSSKSVGEMRRTGTGNPINTSAVFSATQ